MPELIHLPSLKPQLPTVFGFTAPPTASSLLTTTTTLLPLVDVHNILIVVIFCLVCFLLLIAFFSAFCFHCSISSSPPEGPHKASGCSLDREDTTYKLSFSDNQSVGNIV